MISAPISIAYLGGSSDPSDCYNVRLKPGYFLSNEPGYYKAYDFGVRLENIIEVVAAETPVSISYLLSHMLF